MACDKNPPKRRPQRPRQAAKPLNTKSRTVATSSHVTERTGTKRLNALTSLPESSRRRKVVKARETFVPSTEQLRGHLNFEDPVEQERYKILSKREIVECKFFDRATLESLDLYESVKKYLESIGWGAYLTMNETAYIELILEFYVTFRFEVPDPFCATTPCVSFRLFGRSFNLSITQFGMHLGFLTDDMVTSSEYINYICFVPKKFNKAPYWDQLCDYAIWYKNSSCADSYIVDPALRVIRRFLSTAFTGRTSSANLCSDNEIMLLHYMQQGVKVHFGYWAAEQFNAVAKSVNESKSRTLVMGPLITRLATSLCDFETNQTNLSCAFTPKPMDLKYLKVLQFVDDEDGVLRMAPHGPPRSSKGKYPTPEKTFDATTVQTLIMEIQGLRSELASSHAQVASLKEELKTVQSNFAEVRNATVNMEAKLIANTQEVREVTTALFRQNNTLSKLQSAVLHYA